MFFIFEVLDTTTDRIGSWSLNLDVLQSHQLILVKVKDTRCNNNHERNEYGTPEGKNHSNQSSRYSYSINISIAYCCQSNNSKPQGIEIGIKGIGTITSNFAIIGQFHNSYDITYYQNGGKKDTKDGPLSVFFQIAPYSKFDSWLKPVLNAQLLRHRIHINAWIHHCSQEVVYSNPHKNHLEVWQKINRSNWPLTLTWYIHVPHRTGNNK